MRRAFTLVELLVSITILVILVALLLPAVQAAREAARLSQCSNNLKQLGLGCLSCEQAQGALPGGGWIWWWQGDPDRGFGIRQPGGWIFNILPYIEQQNLHDMGMGESPTAKALDLQTAAATPLALLSCPTRRPLMLYPNTLQPVNLYQVTSTAHSDYAANTGTLPGSFPAGTFWGQCPPITTCPLINGTVYDPSYVDGAAGFVYPSPDPQPGVYAFDGVVSHTCCVKLALVSDGVSNTYLLGEKYLDQAAYYTGQEQDDNNPILGGMDWDWQRWSVAWDNCGPKQDTPDQVDTFSFGSAHSAGCNMIFCDGSVHLMSFSMDAETHRRLCCRNDGLPVSW